MSQQKRDKKQNLTNAGKGRPKGTLNKVTLEVRAAAKAIVEDPVYVASLTRRVIAGRAPHMEPLLFHYAYGKPKDTVDVTGTLTHIARVVHEYHAS